MNTAATARRKRRKVAGGADEDTDLSMFQELVTDCGCHLADVDGQHTLSMCRVGVCGVF